MSGRIYFAGFNGLRFISILIVLLHHFISFRNNFDTTVLDWKASGRMVQYAVQFFFAGSGFLISYLLLTEYKINGKIALGSFYLRRIFRLWPAYFVLTLLVLLILDNIGFFDIPGVTRNYFQPGYIKANLLYLLMLPQIAGIYYPTAPYLHHTYTIGIEMQFYFTWGVLFVFCRRYLKGIFILLLLLIPVLVAINAGIDENAYDAGRWVLHKYIVGMEVMQYFRFPTFALGGLWAMFYFYKNSWLNIFDLVAVQIAVFAAIVLSIYLDFNPPVFRYEYISFLVLCLFTCASRSKSILNFETSWLNVLGRISYGIYLFHMIAIILALKIGKGLFPSFSSPVATISMFAMALGLSILFGWLSYVGIEVHFLKMKRRFQRV